MMRDKQVRRGANVRGSGVEFGSILIPILATN